MDVALLIAGLVRTAIWAYGSYIAYRRGSQLACCGFGLTAMLACVFAFFNAGADLPPWFIHLNAYLSAPGAALIVVAYITGPTRHRLFPVPPPRSQP